MLDWEQFRTACGTKDHTLHIYKKYLKDDKYVHNPNQKIESQSVIQYTLSTEMGIGVYISEYSLCVL